MHGLPVLIDSRTASFVTWVMIRRTGVALAAETQWTTTQLRLVMSQNILRICKPYNTSYIPFMAFCWLFPSVLWRCWLGSRKGIRPVKKLEWWGAGIVICLERGAVLHMAQLMPLPLTISCSSKIQIGFTFLVPAYPGSPGKSAVKWVCVCVCVCWLLPLDSPCPVQYSHTRSQKYSKASCKETTVFSLRSPAVDPTQSIFKYAVIEPSPVSRTVVNKIWYYYIKQKHTQNRLLQQIIFFKVCIWRTHHSKQDLHSRDDRTLD